MSTARAWTRAIVLVADHLSPPKHVRRASLAGEDATIRTELELVAERPLHRCGLLRM